MKPAFPIRKLSFSFWFVLLGFLLNYSLQGRVSVAKLAAPLRQLIGNEAVASLESLLFGAQDSAKRFQYDMGLTRPEAPWQVSVPVSNEPTPVDYQTPHLETPMPPNNTPTAGDEGALFADFSAMLVATPAVTTTKKIVGPMVDPVPVVVAWRPADLQPLGTLAGEGEWLPYLFNPAGETVAYRTFLQPDPERPFTIVAIVAFDLTKTRLNFVLGTEEPHLPGSPFGSGVIPTADKTAGHLLAAFNGGFMATHGQYGAMANGLEALPPKEGLATVAINETGQIRIGAWGSDILPSDKLVSWRQNAYMVVHNGKITPESVSNSLDYWSGSINSEVVTWRSGLGISQDEKVLYYFAGPSLHMVTLGQTMVTAGVENGMLLDINPYWVHFTAIYAEGDEWLAASLMDSMSNHVDRFLRAYQRDFFYVTVR